MVLKRLLGSRLSRSLSVITVLRQAVRELTSGDRRLGALLVGAALLAWRWSPLAILLELAIRYYRRKGRAA